MLDWHDVWFILRVYMYLIIICFMVSLLLSFVINAI